MADKDFKVKGNIELATPLPAAQGGTGQTTLTNALNAMMPAQTGHSGKFLKTDGTNVTWDTAGGGGATSNSVNSNITLAASNKYFVDTSAARTLTLPSSPTVGDEIYIFDASGTAGTYNITVSRNGNNINGTAGNLIIDTNGAAVALVYTGSTYGWKVG